jgi:hypothetical protein
MLPHLRELRDKEQAQEPEFVSVEQEMAKAYRYAHPDGNAELPEYPENTGLPRKIKEIPDESGKDS